VPDNSPVLKRVAAELAYRSSRIREYIREIGPGTTREYQQIADSIKLALESVESQLPDQMQALTNSAFAEDDRESIFLDYLSRFSRWFVTIHELLIYLPQQPAVPESVSTLVECFGDQYKATNPSVILGSLFNAAEYDFLEELRRRLPDLGAIIPKSEKNFVLELALCDRQSPAAWAVLAHELGHAIDHANGLSDRVTNHFVTDPNSEAHQLCLAWTREFCADLIAAKAVGPAAILSVLNLEYCAIPLSFVHLASATHPTTRWRLKVVSDFLSSQYGHDYLEDERQLYDRTWIYSARRQGAVDDEANRLQQDDQTFETALKPVVDQLLPLVEGLDLPAHNVVAESVERCLARLHRGVPISAQGHSRSDLREKVRAYRQQQFADHEAQVTAFRQLKRDFLEEPLGAPTILMSAHLCRCEKLAEVESEPATLSDRASMKRWCAELAEIDRVVAISIQMSATHQNVAASINAHAAAPA